MFLRFLCNTQKYILRKLLCSCCCCCCCCCAAAILVHLGVSFHPKKLCHSCFFCQNVWCIFFYGKLWWFREYNNISSQFRSKAIWNSQLEIQFWKLKFSSKIKTFVHLLLFFNTYKVFLIIFNNYEFKKYNLKQDWRTFFSLMDIFNSIRSKIERSKLTFMATKWRK